jgi:hypothetical protein
MDRDSPSDIDMDEQGKTDWESDVEIIGKGKMKAKERNVPAVKLGPPVQAVKPKPPVPAAKQKPQVPQEQSDGEEVPPPKSKKPAARFAAKPQTEDEDGDSDVEATIIVSRPRTKPRPQPIPTGELHHPPCDQCDKLHRPCEKERSGRACVSCKRNKHRCNYSFPNAARTVKSKATVEESEWEDAAGDGAATGAATTSRAARPAAKRAKQAIQDEAATASKPARGSRKKSNPPGFNAAAVLNAAAGEYAVPLFSTSAD